MPVSRRNDDSAFNFEFLPSRTFIKDKQPTSQAREKSNVDREQINRNVNRIRNCNNNNNRNNNDRDRDKHNNKFNDNFIDSIRLKSILFILFRRFDYIPLFSRYFARDDVNFIEAAARRKIKKNKVLANRFRVDNNEIFFIFVNHRFVVEKTNFYDHVVNTFVDNETREAHQLTQVKKIIATNKTRVYVNKNNEK